MSRLPLRLEYNEKFRWYDIIDASGRKIASRKQHAAAVRTLGKLEKSLALYKQKGNPTKAQKREKSRKASVQRRVAVALAKFLKQANPAMKTTGATVTRLKGGGFTIRPIKATKRGKR